MLIDNALKNLIYLATKSDIEASLFDKRWKGLQADERAIRASLSSTLVVSQAHMILLFVHPQAKYAIAVIFIPNYKKLLYAGDDFATFAYAHCDGDKVFCFNDNRSSPLLASTRYHVNRLREMIASQKQERVNAVDDKKDLEKQQKWSTNLFVRSVWPPFLYGTVVLG